MPPLPSNKMLAAASLTSLSLNLLEDDTPWTLSTVTLPQP